MQAKDVKRGDVLFRCTERELSIFEVVSNGPAAVQTRCRILSINRITGTYNILIIRLDKDLNDLVSTTGGFYTCNEDKAVKKYKELLEKPIPDSNED